MKFVITLLTAGVFMALVSLVWPRFSDQPRPEILNQMRQAVLRTPIGLQTATVLGVSDETTVQRFNMQSTMGDLTASAASAVQQRAQTILTIQAVKQLQQQFSQLPSDQQEQIKQIICQPGTPTEP